MAMKTPPDTPEFAKFTEAVRDIMKVSKSEMQGKRPVLAACTCLG
jgi:hypothetical protein